MKTDCEWFNSNLEAYCCDTLDAPDLLAAKEHLKQCPSCTSEIEALENVDSLVHGVLLHRLSEATAKRASRVRFLPVAVVASTVAAALLFALSLPSSDAPAPSSVGETTAPAVAGRELVSAPPGNERKNTVDPPIQRAKPTDEGAVVLQPRPDLDAARAGGPDFAVIDTSGYSMNLDYYKGYFLVMGIWSEKQPETIATMSRIYNAFGHDPQVRILGVASARQEPLDRATFPVAFNMGSRLLGLKTGELVLVDKSGHQRWNGSLTEPADVVLSKIKSQMEPAR